MASESGARDGVVASQEILDFTYTKQLVSMVLDNWNEDFDGIFGDRGITAGLLGFVLSVRNTSAHSRELLQFERDLLSGTAGRLSNQIGLWRARGESSTRYFPQIESVIDRFGSPGYPAHSGVFGMPAPPVIEVGEILTFECRAIPSARRFAPRWFLGSGDYMPSRGLLDFDFRLTPDTEGESVTLSLPVTSKLVSQQTVISVVLYTESMHHRGDGVDDSVHFHYRVVPPDDE